MDFQKSILFVGFFTKKTRIFWKYGILEQLFYF